MRCITCAVLVVCVLATWACSAAENLIVNGAFEEGAVGGAPSRWRSEGYDGAKDTPVSFTIVDGGHDSPKCAHLALPEAAKWGLVDQKPSIPNDPSKGVVFSAWIRSDSPSQFPKGFADLAIFVQAKNRKSGNLADVRQSFPVTAEWKRHEVGLLMRDAKGLRPDDQLVARGIIQIVRAQRDLLIDDVSLTVTSPEEAKGAFKATLPEEYQKHLLDASKHASFVHMKDGRPAIFYHKDGLGPIFRTSDDQGLTWGLPNTIDLEEGVCARRMIQPVRLKSGALGLVTVGTHKKRWVFYFTVSNDEGKSWGESVAINPDGPICWPLHDSAFATSKGRIVVPGMITFKGDEHDNKNWSGPVDVETYCWLSDDEGETWFKGENIVTEHEGRKLPFEETVGVELTDGRLMLLGRTPMARIFKSYSSDGGKTWTSPQPTPLVSSYAPCALARMSDGDLVCVFNQASKEEVAEQGVRRARLTAAVSSDDGETWKHHRNLESLDDRHKIEEPVNWDVFTMKHEEAYFQPKDTDRYPHAPGPLCATYPSICTAPDRVIVAYSYTCLPDGARGPFLKVRSLPIKWFYEKP